MKQQQLQISFLIARPISLSLSLYSYILQSSLEKVQLIG